MMRDETTQKRAGKAPRKGHGRVGSCAMTIDLSKSRIFIRLGITDLRKAVNELSVIIQETMKEDLDFTLAGIQS